MDKSRASWILYDIGSSAYILLITGVAFPLYFKVHVTESAAWSDMLWGIMLAASNILAGLLAPVVGAAADLRGRRLRYLAIATVVCCLSTIGLAMPNGGVTFIAAVFVLSYVSYLLAAGLYDSLLKQIVSSEGAGWLSGLGWGFGYIGGLVCYLLSSSLLGSGNADSPPQTFALSFVVVGIFYAGVAGTSLFGLRHLKQPHLAEKSTSDWKAPIVQVSCTVRMWFSMGEVPRVVIMTNLIAGAAVALSAFTPLILAGYFGLLAHQVAFLSAIFAVVSIPATLAAGALASRVNSLRLLVWLMPAWILLMLVLVLGTGWYAGLLVVMFLGLLMGPTISIVRTIVAAAINESGASEIFGMAAFVNRFTAALGLLFFGTLSSASASRWLPVIVIGGLLCLALAFLPKYIRLSNSTNTRS